MNDVIRNTDSCCNECGDRVKASVVARNEGVFLDKDCPRHGHMSTLISRDVEAYQHLENFYFSVMKDGRKYRGLEIDITFRCNMDCPICSWGNVREGLTEFAEPSLDEIKQFLSKEKISTVLLSGGEATCRDDLFEIIRMVKKLGKRVVINTNGIKIADIDYLRQLKETKIDAINITFDGFNEQAEEFLRGQNYLPYKVKALNNLKELNIPTGLNIRIAKGKNESEIAKIVEFAAKNSFIKLLHFGTLGWIGNAAKLPIDQYLMPDQLANIIIDALPGILNKDSVRLFQKLFITLNSFFGRRWCLYDSTSFILLRRNGICESLQKYVNLPALNKMMNKYASLFKKSPFLARGYLLFAGICSIRHIKSIAVLKELFLRGMGFFIKGKKYLNTDSFLYLSINTCCDVYKMDYKIAQNCMIGMVFKDNDGELKFQGSGADICDTRCRKKF